MRESALWPPENTKWAPKCLLISPLLHIRMVSPQSSKGPMEKDNRGGNRVWNITPRRWHIWLQKMPSAHRSFNDPHNDTVKSQQEEQAEAPCPAFPNPQPCFPCLNCGTRGAGPRAAARSALLAVTSLKNSLLPTSFLCRVTRRSSASRCLSQQSGSNLGDATSDGYPWAMVCAARGPPAAPQVLKSPPYPIPELQRQLAGTDSNQDGSVRARMKTPGRNT